MRHPVAVAAAWCTGINCGVTPWLLDPPLWVRQTASLLAAVTAWGLVRAVGGLAAMVRAVLRGDSRRARLAAAMAGLLALAGCTAVPASDPASAVLPVTEVAARATTGPIRVQVPLGAASSDAGRARVAVEQLVRAGGLTVSMAGSVHRW